MISCMNEHRANGLNRSSEGVHPFMPGNHPKVEVVRRVFVVEEVDVLDAQDFALCGTDALSSGNKLCSLRGSKFIESRHVPFCGQDD